MLKISRLTVENMETGCVTDNPQPRVSYCLESDRQNVNIEKSGDFDRRLEERNRLPDCSPV